MSELDGTDDETSGETKTSNHSDEPPSPPGDADTTSLPPRNGDAGAAPHTSIEMTDMGDEGAESEEEPPTAATAATAATTELPETTADKEEV